MRDRLVEILAQADFDFGEHSAECAFENVNSENYYRFIADHLLANGVIVPPVPVGGAVYTLNRGRAKKWKVCFIGLNTRGEIKFHLADDGFKQMLEAWNYDIGKTVFLTREEAEKALAEREGKG